MTAKAVTEACVWCSECGPLVYLCEGCTKYLHSSINVMHCPLLWKEEEQLYVPFPRTPHLETLCSCSTKYTRDLTCVNVKGCFQTLTITFCVCVSEAETLLQLGLFPATPKQPQLAFALPLLDWMEALMLECQVSAQDFVAALGVLTDALLMKGKKCKVYPVIIDSFEEYRQMKNELRHLQSVVPERSDGTDCPACPKEGGEVYLSIDGNFGLCRKRAAGTSVREPLHNSTYFIPQKDVDLFVNNYGPLTLEISEQNLLHCLCFRAAEKISPEAESILETSCER